SRRAVIADPRDPNGWVAREMALMRQNQWNEALEAADKALRIDPHKSDAYVNRAIMMIWMGRPQDAFAELDKADALDARYDYADSLRLRCRAHLALGHYDDAIKLCERAAPLEDLYLEYLYLTAAYAQIGDMNKAANARAELLKRRPGYTIARLRAIKA